jgi:hypothetical protein
LERRHDLEIFVGLPSVYVRHFLPLTSFINICVMNIIKFRIFYFCVCVCVYVQIHMLVYMIKKISRSKLKETYFAISLHINCRHSFCKRVGICYKNTRRHIPHEFSLYTRAVRKVKNVCAYNPRSCFIVLDQSFVVFSRV